MPNAPLHSTSTRPPDGTGGPRRLKVRGSGLDREAFNRACSLLCQTRPVALGGRLYSLVNRQHGKVLLAVADLQVHFAVLHLAEQALAHGRVGSDQHDRLVIQLDLEAGGIGGEE